MLSVAYKPTIAIDFDGTIHTYDKGWHDGTCYGSPINGAKEFFKKYSKDYKITIFTCRQPIDDIKSWLTKHGLMEYVWDVTNEKPKAKLYIDDRGYRFTSWARTLEETEGMLAYEPEEVDYSTI